MSKTIYLFIASGLIILLGTFVMYAVESQVPNSKIKTLLDALWWCVATVTTVGYGDIVPVSNIGRLVALFYMFFGITMIAILLSVITNNVYKRRFEKQKQLGIWPADMKLPEYTPPVTPWSNLTKDQQDYRAKVLAVHAAMIDNMDRNIGKGTQS